jgi:nitrite reductase (NADH) small subunit
VFNVDGGYYTIADRCPHRGGTLCAGVLTGTNVHSEDFGFHYGFAGRILRCGWHGFEFDVTTGRSLVDPKLRAKIYRTEVENGDVVIYT